LQVKNQAFCGDAGHGVVGVAHSFATFIAQRERQRLLDLLRACETQSIVSHRVV